MVEELEYNREENKNYFLLFEQELKEAGLTEKTIRRHLGNVDHYIDHYTGYLKASPMEKSLEESYLMDFFFYYTMYKDLDVSAERIKSLIASLNKFYKCMLKHGYITQEQFDVYKEYISLSKEDMLSDAEERKRI